MKEGRVEPQPYNDNTGGTVTVIAYLGSDVWTCIWERMSIAITIFLLGRLSVSLFLVTVAVLQAELCSS